ncbi:MAG: terpene synthase [Streptomyces sp.]|nr:terpene synthase [Streptomyces sp.]
MNPHAASALEIPPFYCPIPAVQRADAEAIDRESYTWFAGLRACDQKQLDYLAESRCGLVTAWALPEGIPERVRIPADIMYLAEALDDTALEKGALGRSPRALLGTLCRLAEVIESPQIPADVHDPWAEGIRDMRRRVGQWATPLQVTRWMCAWRRLFLGWAWEAAFRLDGIKPSVQDYVRMRMAGSIGMEILTTLIDAAEDFELPDTELGALPVRALTEMNWLIISFDNDLYSYHHESLQHPNGLNFIDVVAHADGCTPADALPSVIAMRDRVMCLFLRLSRQVTARGSQDLGRYITGLQQYVRANIDWGITSRRYTRPLGLDSPPHTWARLPTAFADEPTDDRGEPLPIPAIAWWWDQLT